jgi:glycosyltransferase involved in cell wall biosynthesis
MNTAVNNSKLRVLHFASVINRYDIIDSVLTRLDRSRFEARALTVVPPGNRTGSYAAGEEYHTRCLHTDFKRSNYRRIFAELRKEIREFRPHILQAHHYDEAVMGALAARLEKIPAYVIGHHYSTHIHVLTRGVKRKVYLQIEKMCNDTADRVVVPTQEVVDLLVKQGNKPEKIVHIPFGVELKMVNAVNEKEIQDLREQYNLKDKYVALVCCRLNKEKGLEYLLKAVPALKNRYSQFRLIIAGTGEHESSLRTLAQELQIEDVTEFIGWRKDAMNWFALSDVVIQPSLAESFCQVLTEALAVEKPVIMTPVGAGPEVIVNGERGGHLVPIGDSAAIGTAISSFIENPETASSLAAAGKKYIAENMTFEQTTQKNEKLYLQIATEKIIVF